MLNKNKLLLVVDMQNDFSEQGNFPIEGTTEMANKIHSLITKIRKKHDIHIAYSMD